MRKIHDLFAHIKNSAASISDSYAESLVSFKKIKELPEILLQNIHSMNMWNLKVAQNDTLSL